MNRIITTGSIFSALGLMIYGAWPIPVRADVSALWECKGINIEQTGPATIAVGGRLTYDIRISNTGNCELSESSVMDYIPRMSTFDEASPAPTEYPASHPFPDPTLPSSMSAEHPVSKIEWKNVMLVPGKDLIFKVSAIVRGPEDRVLLNTVCFENPRSGRICSQAETTVTR